MKPVFQTVFIVTYLMQVDNSVVDFEDMLLAKKKRKQEMCTAAGYRQPPMCVNMNGAERLKILVVHSHTIASAHPILIFARNCIISRNTGIFTPLHKIVRNLGICINFP